MMSDENELVERLYRLHFKKLFIYANAVLRDPEQAKDVVMLIILNRPPLLYNYPHLITFTSI